MKRTATLLAGLLLVTGTVFAGEWSVTGARVETNTVLVDTQNGVGGVNGGDLDLEVKAEKAGAYGTVGLVLQNDKDDDTDLRITYSKTEGDWSVATEALLVDSNGDLLGQNKTDEGNMNKGDGTYIKWNVMGSKTTTLTVYPYEVGGLSWDNDTWESFKSDARHNEGGLVVATKVGASDVTVRYAVGKDESTDKNQYTLKGELATKVGTAKLNAAVGYGSGYKTTMAAAKVEMPVSKFTVNAELNTQKTDDADTAVGAFVKGSYKLAAINGYNPTAYASFLMLNEEAAALDGTAAAYTEIEAGLGLNKGSFTVTPKVVINNSDEEIYGKENSDDLEKAAMVAKLTVTFKM